MLMGLGVLVSLAFFSRGGRDEGAGHNGRRTSDVGTGERGWSGY